MIKAAMQLLDEKDLTQPLTRPHTHTYTHTHTHDMAHAWAALVVEPTCKSHLKRASSLQMATPKKLRMFGRGSGGRIRMHAIPWVHRQTTGIKVRQERPTRTVARRSARRCGAVSRFGALLAAITAQKLRLASAPESSQWPFRILRPLSS